MCDPSDLQPMQEVGRTASKNCSNARVTFESFVDWLVLLARALASVDKSVGEASSEKTLWQ